MLCTDNAQLLVAAWTTNNRWRPAVCTGRSLTALFTCAIKLDPGAHGVRYAKTSAVHHALGISHQRNSGYRSSRVNIMAQGLSTPDPSLNPTHLSIRRGRATTTHYTHHQVSLMVSRNTTLVPSLGLCIRPACEAGLSAGMRRERVSPQNKKQERRRNKPWSYIHRFYSLISYFHILSII